MEQIMSVVKWFQENWTSIIAVITSIIGTASVIVKLTPTLKDDTVLQKIVAFLGKYIALNKSINPEDRPK